MFVRKFAVLAAASLIVVNCASTPERLPQLTEDVGSSLDAVGVITIGPSIGGELDGPVGVSDQVTSGFLQGGTIGAMDGVIFEDVGLGVLGLVVGGIAGASRAEQAAIPESTAAEIETALARAIADRELQSDLRHRVLQNIGIATMGVDLSAGGTVPVESPDYVSFGEQDIDAVLEISLMHLGFAGEVGDDPALVLVITVRARLIGVPDNGVLWNVEQVTYESAEAAFSLWTLGDYDLLQAEIDDGLESLASQISEALFGAPAT